MSIKYFMDLEQGTDEWLSARLGILTASEVNSIVTPKGKQSAGKAVHAYACELASQRANMQLQDTYQSFKMLRGHLEEEVARDVYNNNFDEVTECGFITRSFGNHFKIGCSPDGLVRADGGIEIKSRDAKFQVQTIVANKVPDEYINQIQTFLLVTQRKWCDFVQYSNGMPLFVKRVYPDIARHNLIGSAAGDLEKLVVSAHAVYQAASDDMIQCERVEFDLDDHIDDDEQGEIE